MEAGGVLLPGNLTEGRIRCGAHWCAYQAADATHQARGEAPKRRDYYVRVSAAAVRGGPLLLSVECRHGASRACRYSLPRTPLLTFDPMSVSAEEMDHESAGQWCSDLLEKCAQACRDANRRRSEREEIPNRKHEIRNKSETGNLKEENLPDFALFLGVYVRLGLMVRASPLLSRRAVPCLKSHATAPCAASGRLRLSGRCGPIR